MFVCVWVTVWVLGGLLAIEANPNARLKPTAGSMPAHRLRRWPTINPTLCQCLVFTMWVPSKHETLHHCWVDGGPSPTTSAQRQPMSVHCLAFAGLPPTSRVLYVRYIMRCRFGLRYCPTHNILLWSHRNILSVTLKYIGDVRIYC